MRYTRKKKNALTAFARVLMAALLVFAPFAQPAQAAGINVTIDGWPVVFAAQAPVNVDGSVLVPVRGVFEQLGFTAAWDGGARQATLTDAANTVVLTIGSATFTANGMTYTLAVPAQLINGSTMLPIRFPLEAVGYALTWDAATQTARVISPGIAPPPIATPEPIPEPTPTPAPQPTPAPADTAGEFERRVFELTNDERAKAGVPALTWDDTLAAAARLHSEDMAKNNYFDHTGLDGSSPGKRAERAGATTVISRGWAENIIAGYPSPEAAVAGWMDSPGHKANILNKDLTHLGVGFAQWEGSAYNPYATQLFGRAK